MSVVLLGTDQDAVVKFRNQRWWAEKGLICLEDKTTGHFESMTVTTCLERLKAINDMIGNSKKRSSENNPQLVQEHQNFVDGMIVVCKRAQEQGRPDVAAHQEQMRKDRKSTSRMMVAPGRLGTF